MNLKNAPDDNVAKLISTYFANILKKAKRKTTSHQELNEIKLDAISYDSNLMYCLYEELSGNSSKRLAHDIIKECNKHE